MGWIEVKSTGLNETGKWDNAFSTLRWRNDFGKLGGVKRRELWNFDHGRAWIWLYQFANYRKKVDRAFGTDNEWSSPKAPSATGDVFGPIGSQRMNLPRVLSEIEAASAGILMSVCPRVHTGGRRKKVFSAIIVTAMVSPARGRQTVRKSSGS